MNVEQPNGAQLFVGGALCLAPRGTQGTSWPARLFIALNAASPAIQAPSKCATLDAALANDRGAFTQLPTAPRTSPDLSGSTMEEIPDTSMVWVKFFGVPEASSLQRVRKDAIHPFPLLMEIMPSHTKEERAAELQALDWARRNAHRRAGVFLPAAETMDLLVGKGIEVLSTRQDAWIKAIVQVI